LSFNFQYFYVQVADAVAKERDKVKALNIRLTFTWKEMYTLRITPLCVAVFYRNLDVIELLLRNGLLCFL
jgi:hypothetical protein